MENTFCIRYFPISFFSMVMGLTGFVLAIQRAEDLFNAGRMLSTYLLFAVILVFLLIVGIYTIKILKYFPDVLEEIDHPIRLSFFSTFTVSLLLFSIAFLEVNLLISQYFWISGTVAHFLMTVVILSIWIQQSKFEIHHFNPAWFIPIVGNILIPISGVRHFSPELSWFFFSVGIIFWVPMFTIFLYRIIFHQPMPEKILPTFFILIPPPALGFVSYVNLNGGMDNLSKMLYYFALFMTILLMAQIKLFYRLKFSLSWWAYTFPLAAITTATALMYNQTGFLFYKFIFLLLMGMLSLIIFTVLFYTIKAIKSGAICVKEAG